jgi:hypothetical protein
VAEIRLLVENLDEMHTIFSCGDFSLNLLMQVDGYLDERKATCSANWTDSSPFAGDSRGLCPHQGSSYMQYPLEAAENEESCADKTRDREARQGRPEGFYKYIETLKSYQLPQPQTEEWK